MVTHAASEKKVDGNVTGVGECVYKGGKVREVIGGEVFTLGDNLEVVSKIKMYE